MPQAVPMIRYASPTTQEARNDFGLRRPPQTVASTHLSDAPNTVIDLLDAAQTPAVRGSPSQLQEPFVACAWPLVWGAASSGGKLVASIGGSAAVRARFDGATSDKIISAVLLAAGLCTAVTAAWQFGRDVHAQAPPRVAWGLKTVSVSAALCLATGAALKQLSTSAKRPHLVWAAYAITLGGYGLVAISLPNFFAYSEAHRGLAIMRHREPIRQALASVGMAVGFAWAADIGPKQALPPYVGAAILTLAATSLLLSLGLATSNSRRARRAGSLTLA